MQERLAKVTRLEEITRLGSEWLSNATDEELGDFRE